MLYLPAALMVAAGLAATACGETPAARDPFDITLSFDSEPGSTCSFSQCDDYPMTCDARLMFLVYDADGGGTFNQDCVTVEWDPDRRNLCALDGFQKRLFMVPLHDMRVSIAIWRRGLIPETCPQDEIFDLDGKPRIDFAPRPAFAGSVYFDVGSQLQAVVPLSCTEPAQLTRDDCTGPSETTVIDARVADIETAADITPEQAAGLDVLAAEPRAVAAASAIDRNNAVELPAADGQLPPAFSTRIDGAMGETVCTVVSEPDSTPTAVCQRAMAGADPLQLRGILVPRQVLAAVLSALQLETVPEGGILIGRVVDEDGQPVSGVSLTPDQGEVVYLDADLSLRSGSDTSQGGYFVSLEVPFGARWRARHVADGRVEEGEPRAGLLRNAVTALFIRMERTPSQAQ